MKREYFVFFIFILFIDANCKEDKLRYVFAFSRNGARAPLQLDFFKHDVLGEKWIDSEDISGHGLQQEYIKGAKLKRHYIDRLNFLSKKYDSREIEAYSSDFSASIITSYTQLMSMYPVAYGMRMMPEQQKAAFPPYDLYNSEEIFKTLGVSPLPKDSQVFPVKTFPPENNYFGLTDPNNCVGVKKLVEKKKNSTVLAGALGEFSKKHSNILKNVLKVNENYFFHYDNVYSFCDALLSGIVHNKNFTIFKKNKVNDTYIHKNLYKDCKNFMMFDLYKIKLEDPDKNILRYSMSNLIRKLCHRFDTIISNDNNKINDKEKFLIYTGHETDLAAFLAYLNMTINTKLYMPKYGSTLIMEFIKSKNAPEKGTSEDYLINIYFDDKTLINIRYRDFKMTVLPATVKAKSVNIWCGIEDNSGLYFFIAACVLFTFAIAIGIWIYIIYKRHKKEQGEENEEELHESQENRNSEEQQNQ